MDTAIRTTSLTAPRLAFTRSQWFLFSANAVGLIALLTFLLTTPVGTARWQSGDVAGETVIAPRTFTFTNRIATEANRKRAMAQVPTSYTFDTRLARERWHEAAVFLQRTTPVLSAQSSPAAKLSRVRKLLPPGVTSAALQQFSSLSPADLKVVRQYSLLLLSQAEALRFDATQKQATEFGLLPTIPARASLSQRTAIGEVLTTFLSPTLLPNWPATTRKQQKALAAVRPVRETIFSGEVIVRRGDLVTPTVMEELGALGLLHAASSLRDYGGSLLFAALIVAMLFWYLHAFHPGILAQPRLLLLIDASILATVAAARLLTAGHVLLPYFMPAAAATTFAAALMAPEACIALALAVALLSGWVVASSFELAVYYLLSGAAGILAVRHLRQLKQFVLAGAYIACFALVTMLAFGVVDRSFDLASLREDVLAAGFNGFVSSTLALGGFALLAEFFGVTTTLQLLELGQPNQPLLRRLMVKAPGTYNHSVIVSNMVERAAEEIGANALVAKVGALYHDVGKSANPHCFVENQLGMANIHDELRPEESARIIRGHVVQGLRLARQFKLPRVILDAIGEHHGTMTISFFLHKAQEEQDRPVDPALYSYPGPKPQSKETALLMLADGCESVVRASPDHSSDRIRDTVDRLIQDRVQQGQLDECPLTLSDLDRARSSFCAVLNGLYHPRIDYPESVDPLVSGKERTGQVSAST